MPSMFPRRTALRFSKIYEYDMEFSLDIKFVSAPSILFSFIYPEKSMSNMNDYPIFLYFREGTYVNGLAELFMSVEAPKLLTGAFNKIEHFLQNFRQ